MKPLPIVVTRPELEGCLLRAALKAHAGPVLDLPLLEIVPLPLPPLPPTDWLFITSVNGVRHGLARWPERTTPVAALGAATAAAAEKVGHPATWISPEPSALGAARALAAEWAAEPTPQRRRLTWLHGTLADTEAVRAALAPVADVTGLPVYATHRVLAVPPDAQARLAATPFVLTLASGSAAAAWADLNLPTEQARVVCLGPQTALDAVRYLGRVDATAPHRDMAALAELAMALATEVPAP